jgi:Acetyltransferase (GNAT) domain
MVRGRTDLRGDCCAGSFRIDQFNPSSLGLTITVHRTVRGIPRGEWDACFPGDPEGWAYYRAIEEAGLATFAWAYFVARENGRTVAIVPAFITDYSLDTTIQGRWKIALQPLLRHLKNLLTLRMLCLGSPLADKCHLGFIPDLVAGRRREILEALLSSVDAFAAAQGIGLTAAKDVAGADLDHDTGAVFAAAGFARQPSLPNTVLTLPPDGEAAYLKSLSHSTRRDVRRKLKAAHLVRIEQRHGRDALHLVPELFRLYEGQRDRSGVNFEQFENLTPEYFRHVLIEQGDAAVVFLYFHDERLVAFNLCYHTGRLFIDKFIGFEPSLARTLNLYVLSWMANVRYCFARGIPLLQTGQTSYAMKLRMGSSLRPNWILFRHRNPILNAAIRLAGPMLAADRHDDDLAREVGRTQ